MLGWVIRFLLILLVIRAVWRLLAGVIEGASGAPERRPRIQPRVPLVRDPVCGTYVVPNRELSAGCGDAAKYFCSDRCRREYQRAHRA